MILGTLQYNAIHFNTIERKIHGGSEFSICFHTHYAILDKFGLKENLLQPRDTNNLNHFVCSGWLKTIERKTLTHVQFRSLCYSSQCHRM